MVTSCCVLGGVIGDTDGRNSFVSRKVQEWFKYIEVLYSVAISQPQATYIDLTRSLQNKWTFLQCITPSCGQLFDKLDDAITSQLLPALFGQDNTSTERLLYSLPTHMGSLNLKIPTQTADITYFTSRNASKHLIDSILKKIDFSISDHDSQVLVTKNDFHRQQLEADSNNFSALFDQLDPFKQCSLLRAQNSLSAWLNTIPVQKDNFDLSAIEFHDTFCFRYKEPLQNLPLSYNGCGRLFTTSHALDCRKGSLVVQRHIEICDTIYDLTSLVFNLVTREPIIQDRSDDPPQKALVAISKLLVSGNPKLLPFSTSG